MITDSAVSTASAPTSDDAELFRTRFAKLRDEVHKIIVGNDAVVDGVLIAIIAGGHVLLEGVPGLGKTLLVRTLAQVLDLDFSRIQFTPDLMPADITGTTLLVEDPEGGGRRFQFAPGPIFSNLVLADEVNRATPKTQSALLEAMQEHSVTVGNVTHRLTEPFFVLATQNPIEMEGTYPLPEAQLDRFLFKLKFDRPNISELTSIIQRTTSTPMADPARVVSGGELMSMCAFARLVPIAPHVANFAAQMVIASHPATSSPDFVKKYVRYGSSPRGAQALVLAAKIRALLDGRYSVAQEDIRAVATPSLRHRIILSFEGIAEGISADRVVEEIVKTVTSQNVVKYPT
jgi:MoxR-like ATPase